MAVQVGKALGAHVTASASAANTALLRQLGADECIDHRATDYATLPSRFDVVLDCACTSSYFHARPVMAKGAVYMAALPGLTAILGLLLARLFGHRAKILVVKYLGADGEALAKLVSDGKVTPVLGRSLTLDEVPAALDAMRLGQRVAGKQVVKIG